METQSIRVDSGLLNSHNGDVVRVIGRLESYDPSRSVATLVSNGNIQLDISQIQSPLQLHKVYEVIGKASGGQQVLVYSLLELSDNTSVDAAAKLAHYVHKVPELFYTEK